MANQRERTARQILRERFGVQLRLAVNQHVGINRIVKIIGGKLGERSIRRNREHAVNRLVALMLAAFQKHGHRHRNQHAVSSHHNVLALMLAAHPVQGGQGSAHQGLALLNPVFMPIRAGCRHQLRGCSLTLQITE